ncbi:hypothetical protein MPPM_4818 [Methylorubrum populi]|uniref:Uncharacterized protein n=1 Tax=Methylorubrum populi TaxID=223967 RepID=A0A160PL80_9HYPH|nr:hypothetical protein [Methylorubrum populi]BAU93423.1 hypothetical protein MPPM_4818 [Methylorubrum populi]
MHPDFQRGEAYGERFDDEIVAALDDGLNGYQAAARIGISRDFVVKRARELGFENAWRQRRRPVSGRDPLRPTKRPGKPSKAAACAYASRPDDHPTRLARSLRRQLLVVDRDGLDPSHGVACLHAAGLTLDEIERFTGVPVPAVIAAVRRHCSLSTFAEVRA